MVVSVSVILPAYNRSTSLMSASESVLNQSYHDLELIIVEDASTEDIQKVVEALNDDRVRFIRRVFHARPFGVAGQGRLCK